MASVVKDNAIQIERLELEPFGTNAYLLMCRLTNNSVLIDAPAQASKIREKLKGTAPKYILITHTHMDHVGALLELKSKLNIPIAIHPSDAKSLPLAPDILLSDGDAILFGNIKLRVFHTPGHTPGSVCFLTGHHLISGDTIFPGGPGKTSSPNSMRQIIESITSKIFVLADGTKIYPGHGDYTVLAKEKQEFAIFSSKPHDANLCGDVLWLSS